MTLFERLQIAIFVATIIAIILGPVLAVIITRIIDRRNEMRERKLRIFRELMQTRMLQIDPSHVGALNLVELEFYGDSDIVQAYRTYIQHLSSAMPMPDDQIRFFEERRDHFLTLMQSIGRNLGYNFDKREIDRLGYAPLGWSNDQQMVRNNVKLLSEVLSGDRPIRIAPHAAGQFPPPPKIES